MQQFTNSRRPEVETNSQKIDKIIKRIDDGDIKIPAFQRGYVWDQEQILDLLDSIISEFPIGSILLWEASEKEKLKSTRNIAGYIIPSRPDNYPLNYVLDGQQRVSSIYAVFSDRVQQDAASNQYNPNLDIFEIYYDLKEKKFKSKKDCDTSSDHILYLRNLIHPTKNFDEISRIDSNFQASAKEIAYKFLNYELPVVTIKNRSRSEVGIIFERINNTGTKLDTVDLMTAWTWTEDFHLVEAIESLNNELDEKGFGAFGDKLILQIVSAIVLGSTTTAKLISLSGEQVRDNWQGCCEAIKKATDFLATEMKCLNIDFLPFHQQLVPISVFFYQIKNPGPTARAFLKKWFWRTSFSDRYSTGQTTSKMDVDVEIIKEIGSENYTSIERHNYTVTSNQFIETQFSRTNPLTRAFLLLMAQSEPLDLVSKAKIDLDTSLSSYNRKQFHHIFPNAYLTKINIPKNKRFSLINFCFLPANSNKQISKKEPKDYFAKIIPTDHFEEILESNLLPKNKDIYDSNDYDFFLKERAQLALERINNLTKV